MRTAIIMPFALMEGYDKGGWKGALAATAGPGIIGAGLHKASNYLANNALNKIAQQTLQRSPAGRAALAPNPNLRREWTPSAKAQPQHWWQVGPPPPASPTGASPFRTTVPVGLGTLSGMSGQ